MEVIGYKCFNKDFTNRYGSKFEVGNTYIANGKIKFGNNGNGFHLCKNFEDTFRYFDAMNDDIKLCLVKGSGKIAESFDDYYGYYDMYSVEKLEILKDLSRKEIIKLAISLNESRVERFISLFRLTEEELELFKYKFNKYKRVLEAISYYQEENKNVYKKTLRK